METSELLRRNLRGMQYPSAEHCTVVSPLTFSATGATAFYGVLVRLSDLVVDTLRDLAAGDLRRLIEPAGLGEHPMARFISNSPSARWSASVMRPDIVVSAGRLKVIEFNYNSILSGSSEALILAETFGAIGQRYSLGSAVAVGTDYARLLIDLADDIAAVGPRAPRVAIIYSGAERTRRFSRYFDVVFERLGHYADAVHIVELGDVDIDRGWIVTGGRRADVAIRLFNTESAHEMGLHLGLLAEMERVYETVLLASSECLIFTSNIALALLHERAEQGYVDAATRALIKNHIPWTALLRDGLIGRNGRTTELLEFALTNRSRLVLKPLIGHSGRAIAFGVETEARAWQELLEAATLTGGFCVQEHVVGDRFDLPVFDPQRRGIQQHRATAVFGPFLVGRRRGNMIVRLPAEQADKAAINWETETMRSVVMTA
ncbi:hypothetical protein HLB23_38350 [Nocardia uniformis]|uniref:Circularly permuted type 2 ATP-grasp protein n=1 Tax=Nocardia uniformis TaxID=53432 RepID=A0A849CFN0_9NOCA|nr:hypothetical protein [Nocardia uniformis]NNH75650.1 hypothetical protein [Nocardia uniformis]